MSVQTPLVSAAALECATRSRGWRRYVLLLAVAGVLYGPFVGIPHFGDDYLYLFEAPWSAVGRYFVSYHDLGGIFRPLQMAWCAINQALFGESTVVLQGTQVALHAGLSLLVWRFLERRGVRRAAAATAAVLFVVHPIHVSAVLGTDTGSQLAAALLGFAAFTQAWEHAVDAARPAGASAATGAVRGWPVVVLLALALLSKETALSYAVLVAVVLLYGAWRRRGPASGAAARGAVVLALACILATAVYFAYRGRMAPTRIAWSPTDPYGFHIGVNVLKNQAFLFGGALVPASTSDLFAAVARRSGTVLGVVGGLTALWCGLLAVGLWRARRPVATVGLLLAASLTTFPVTLMNHVSELYIYNLMPLLAVLIGLALAPLLEPGESGAAAESATAAGGTRGGPPAPPDRGPAARGTPAAVLAILFLVTASSGLAVQRKAAEMRANGRAAEQLAAAVVDVTRTAPPDATITLWERPHPGRAYYSVFRTSDFQGLLVAERWLKFRAGRDDVTIRVVDEEREPPAGGLVFVRVEVDGRAALRPLSSAP